MPPDQPIDPRLTEQRNPLTSGIDQLSPLEIVELINSEDAKVAPAVYEERDAVARAVELAEQALKAGGRLIYAGAGTSGRLGVLDASEMPPTYGTDPDMVQGIIAGGMAALTRSQEGAEDHPERGAAEMDQLAVGPTDFVLGIAASGSTPFVHGALARAAERGARTGLLQCTHPDPAHLEQYDVVIAPLVGPEVVTGSTRMKAGTATKLVLNTISTGAMIRLGKVFGNLMVDLRATNLKLQDRSERILMEMCELDRESARLLLDRADGSVKMAVAMYWTELSPPRPAGSSRKLADAWALFSIIPPAVKPEELAAFPLNPDSEFEWEDLLLRLELMPRALKVELENTREADAGGLLHQLVERESFVEDRLESAATAGDQGGAESSSRRLPEDTQMVVSNEAMVDRFVRLRSRNFAMLQRRGIEVWSWTVQITPNSQSTLFQLLSLLARGDVEILASLRRARSADLQAC